jgi:outer membrane protein insertion porin family
VSEFGESEFVPSRDRFFLGGAFTLRGFDENSVFPVDGQGREGGETIALVNFELRHALFWKFWSSLFIDSGLNAPNLELLRWDQFVFSGGAGLQFMSPVGPIRLDYGQRAPVHGIDPGGRIHLSILYAF